MARFRCKVFPMKQYATQTPQKYLLSFRAKQLACLAGVLRGGGKGGSSVFCPNSLPPPLPPPLYTPARQATKQPETATHKRIIIISLVPHVNNPVRDWLIERVRWIYKQSLSRRNFLFLSYIEISFDQAGKVRGD